MKQYLELLSDIRENGEDTDDRTGVGTRSVTGRQVRYDLREGFPAVTTKKLYMKSVKHELLWLLSGSSNIEYLAKNNVHIWDEWPYKHYLKKTGQNIPDTNSTEWSEGMADFIKNIATDHDFATQHGDLGPIYGVQWRKWQTPDGREVDQIANVIDSIKNNPNSRRHIVSAWNPGEIDEIVEQGGLPPCHSMFQFHVRKDDTLDLHLYQRSADTFLGVPFNIASYALLQSMVAQVTDKQPGEFIHTMSDAHIYKNHFEQVDEQLSRTPKALARLALNDTVKRIDDFTFDDIKLEGYESHPEIKAPIAV